MQRRKENTRERWETSRRSSGKLKRYLLVGKRGRLEAIRLLLTMEVQHRRLETHSWIKQGMMIPSQGPCSQLRWIMNPKWEASRTSTNLKLTAEKTFLIDKWKQVQARHLHLRVFRENLCCQLKAEQAKEERQHRDQATLLMSHRLSGRK